MRLDVPLSDSRLSTLTASDKAIAAIQIGHGLFGLAWIWWIGLPFSSAVPNGALALCGIAGGAGSLLGKKWGVLLGVLFYAVQVMHVSTPAMQFSFTLGLNAILSAGWGSVIVGVNVFALALTLWAATRAPARFTSKAAN